MRAFRVDRARYRRADAEGLAAVADQAVQDHNPVHPAGVREPVKVAPRAIWARASLGCPAAHSHPPKCQVEAIKNQIEPGAGPQFGGDEITPNMSFKPMSCCDEPGSPPHFVGLRGICDESGQFRIVT